MLDGVSCQIEVGQRIGLLGRNGAGKTTLMRMLSGQVEPDAGQLGLDTGVTIGYLPQDVPHDATGTVATVVEQGLADGIGDEEAVWKTPQRIEQMVSQMGLEAGAVFDRLSSGMKRRVLLAQTLVSRPDLILLDEPTNHLDISSIRWLEEFLLHTCADRTSGRNATLLFVTHDRAFLRRLATRIWEIDRGRIFDWSCDYDTFLARKEAALAAEEKQNALFDKKLAQEEVWIRQGIKARRTRNEGRVRKLELMRRQRQARRSNAGTARITIDEGQRTGQLVARVEEVSFAFDDRPIVTDFSTTIMRGDKVGVIGANGAGKTTLLRILLGELAPQQGTVRLGTNLQLAYFDQLREQLEDDETVSDSVGGGAQSVAVGGRSKHILGYLQDFLFTPERARTPIRFLSGGERNRVLLARLFARPANVLVLDEPTNDLDTETLELLEQKLVDYQGTVLVVSHDRVFLNNVVTSTIVFATAGVREYVGGYDDWLRQQPTETDVAKSRPGSTARGSSTEGRRAQSVPQSKPKRRLKFKEQQELAALPDAIDQLEKEIAVQHELLAEPEFYRQPGTEIAQQQRKLKQLEQQLAVAYARWEELESEA